MPRVAYTGLVKAAYEIALVGLIIRLLMLRNYEHRPNTTGIYAGFRQDLYPK